MTLRSRSGPWWLCCGLCRLIRLLWERLSGVGGRRPASEMLGSCVGCVGQRRVSVDAVFGTVWLRGLLDACRSHDS